MTTATASKTVTDTELNELVGAYRECQVNAKAWEDERGRVRPVLEQKMAERGATLWECEFGKAVYIDARGAIDYEGAFHSLLAAHLEGLPANEQAVVSGIWNTLINEAHRKPGQRRFEVRAPLKVFMPKNED